MFFTFLSTKYILIFSLWTKPPCFAVFLFEQIHKLTSWLYHSFMISLSLLVLILYWSVYSSLSIQHSIIIPNLYWSSLVYGVSLHCVNLSRTASNYKHTNCNSLYTIECLSSIHPWPLSLNYYFAEVLFCWVYLLS